MKIYFFYLCAALIVLCSQTEHFLQINNNSPKLTSKPTYKVLIDEDIVYAEGLVHKDINSPDASVLPLKLDVYKPDNHTTNRPVYMFIHGGGFSGGSKTQEAVVNLAHYYTSRGWVFVSIDYRLKKHKGTVPKEWIHTAKEVPSSKVNQFLAIYPAVRDAKAALRWVIAHAKDYHINTNYITVGGASAGAMTAIALSISNPEDFRDELTITQDSTLHTTHIDETYQIKTLINLWGSKIALDGLEKSYNVNRFSKNAPALFTAHGTLDPIVPFSHAEELNSIYRNFEIPHAFYPLENKKHGVWNGTINSKRLEELAFNFIVKQQKLQVD